MTLFARKSLDDVEAKIPRAELVRRSRILVIDDERPDLLEVLAKAGFAVDYSPDASADMMARLEQLHYDLLLLDFGNVGREFGADEGLSLLRHIRRINPGIVVLAYTSKSLSAKHAQFFRDADGVLAKDAGITDSTEKIEEALRLAHSPKRIWTGLIALGGVAAGSEVDQKWQSLIRAGIDKPAKMKKAMTTITAAMGSETAKGLAEGLIGKLAELAVKGLLGG